MNTLKTVAANIFNLEKDRAPLEEIAERIYSGGTLKGTNMCILILAIFIASIGLNMNSTAVIIGAMLISPLMGVIMSLGYGMATYDTASTELLARTEPNIWDVLIAIFGGVEGATVATENKDGQIIPTGFLAVITCKSPLTEDEQARLQKWLNAEAELPVSFILRITPETD